MAPVDTWAGPSSQIDVLVAHRRAARQSSGLAWRAPGWRARRNRAGRGVPRGPRRAPSISSWSGTGVRCISCATGSSGNHEDASDLIAGRVPPGVPGAQALPRAVDARDLALPDRRQRLPEPREREDAASEPIDDRQFADTRPNRRRRTLLREERADPRTARDRAGCPKKQRAALVLRMYHEMSHQEIAEVLGSSVGAAKANVFHALQNLKRALGEE